MYIDKNWNYVEILVNAETLKNEYRRTLASFLWNETRQRVKYIKEIKDLVYSLNISEGRKDKIWEYFNDDIPLPVLTKFL